MNPITNIRNQNRLNERELELGIAGDAGKSWHQKYADSAWIFVGGLPYDLTEGDVIAVFSQYGEIVNINLIRDRKTGKSKGFGFVCYQDQRSTILAVDNLNGIKVIGRMIRVDHVEEYKVPKYREEVDPDILHLWQQGCAPQLLPVDDQEEQQQDISTVLLDHHGLVPFDEDKMDESLRVKIKEEKKQKKLDKKREKMERKLKKRKIKLEEEDEEKQQNRDLYRSWKDQRRTVDDLDLGNMDDDYGQNPHFSFGKGRKELPPPPTHNIRPDFEKADWRDVEIWKLEREREKLLLGDDGGKKEEEVHYLPTRFKR